MFVSEFDYYLPKELIAQEPVEPRDASRLLVVDRKTGDLYDGQFTEIDRWLFPGDVLVLNNTKVIPARVFGTLPNGGKVEFLLLRKREDGISETLVRPARKAKPGVRVKFIGEGGNKEGNYEAVILERRSDGVRLVRFEPEDITPLLESCGELALPPYIKKRCENPQRYQTIYAVVPGAVAAPTAGLHFTPEIFNKIYNKGVQVIEITLHCNLGTFRPIKTDKVEEHRMYPEEFEISEEAGEIINQALKEKRRLVCVGTTVVRVLESQAVMNGDGFRVKPGKGETDLYIYPGYQWKVTGALLTNFHLPKSTLLLLVSAFATKELIMKAYNYAIEKRFRFYSFGDAMFIF